MFYFWREATAALVPGFLCQSGRRRPENVSILSSLLCYWSATKDQSETLAQQGTKHKNIRKIAGKSFKLLRLQLLRVRLSVLKGWIVSAYDLHQYFFFFWEFIIVIVQRESL